MSGPITYVGAGTEATPVASGGSLLVPYPAGLAAGDVLVMLTMASVSTAWATGAATGFTRHATGTAGGSSPSAAVYFKIATGSETGSLIVTSPGGTSFGRMFAYRGVDNTTTFDTTDGTFASSTAVTAYDITTQTTTVANCMLGNFVWSNASTGSFTPATQQGGYTELWDSNGGGVSTVMEYAHVVSWSSSGATGTRNVVRSAGVRGGGIGFALRPTSASGTLAVTLADATLAATGGETDSGTLAVTVAGATLAASGTVANPVTGTLATTLAGAILAATGTETVQGTLSAALAGATLAGTAVETDVGTLAVTLTGATLAATGQSLMPITGTLAATLAGATLTATGTEAITGTLTTTLAGASLASTGTESHPAVFAVTLQGAALSATGVETFTGTLAVVLGGATLAAMGAERITGTLAATLSGATMTAHARSGFPRDLTLAGAVLGPRISGQTAKPRLAAAAFIPRISGQREA